MEEKWLVGVDLGGTTIKLAFINVYGEILHKWEIPTNTGEQGKHITLDVAKAVKEVKAGKVDFKIDKQGIIHASVGKASFSADKIKDNAAELINMVTKLKPASSKGTYLQSISLSTTMSPGIKVDTGSIAG